MVSFSPELHKDLDKSCVSRIPVALVNCQVKETSSKFAIDGGQFEVIASARSRVQQSPEKEFIINTDVKNDAPSPIVLERLDDYDINQFVTGNRFVTSRDCCIKDRKRDQKERSGDW